MVQKPPESSIPITTKNKHNKDLQRQQRRLATRPICRRVFTQFLCQIKQQQFIKQKVTQIYRNAKFIFFLQLPYSSLHSLTCTM